MDLGFDSFKSHNTHMCVIDFLNSSIVVSEFVSLFLKYTPNCSMRRMVASENK